MASITELNSREMLISIKDLEEKAIQNLGRMNKAPYSRFVVRMRNIARKAGITNPIMVVDIKAKINSYFSIEQPYLILKQDWDKLETKAMMIYKYMPRVFVLDGNKFTAPRATIVTMKGVYFCNSKRL